MEKETMELLQTIAYVLQENNCEHLVDKISKYDYKAAQCLDMFVLGHLK